MYTNTHTTGYSLVEVLIAIAVLLLSVVGPLTIASKSLQSSFVARDQITATYLAQEGIELVTAYRNNSVIDAISTNNFANRWDWVDASNLSACFNGAGCNLDSTVAHSNWSNASLSESCGSANACQATVDGERSKFTRVINLTRTGADDRVYVAVEVRWTTASGANQAVSLETELYDIYDI